MKKLILFAAFIVAVSFTANAQTVTKKVEKAEQSVSTQKDKAKVAVKKAKSAKNAKSAEAKACKKECKKINMPKPGIKQKQNIFYQEKFSVANAAAQWQGKAAETMKSILTMSAAQKSV